MQTLYNTLRMSHTRGRRIMNIKKELAMIDGLMGTVGYYLRKHGYRSTRRNRLLAALYVLRGQPECVARLRDVNWMPIHEMLEEKVEKHATTKVVAQKQGEYE